MADARAKSKTLTDPQAKRDTMRGAFKDIEAVLTPAQKSKLDAERAAYFKAHGGPPGGGNPAGAIPADRSLVTRIFWALVLATALLAGCAKAGGGRARTAPAAEPDPDRRPPR